MLGIREIRDRLKVFEVIQEKVMVPWESTIVLVIYYFGTNNPELSGLQQQPLYNMAHFCGLNIEDKAFNWKLYFIRTKQGSFGGAQLLAYLEDPRPLQARTWCLGWETKKSGLPWIPLSLHAVSEPQFHTSLLCVIQTTYMMGYSSRRKYLRRAKVIAASVLRHGSRKWGSITCVIFYLSKLPQDPPEFHSREFKLHLLMGRLSKNLWAYITCHRARSAGCEKWLNSSSVLMV